MDIQKELEIEFDREAAKTRKMLEAIPDGVDFGARPRRLIRCLRRDTSRSPAGAPAGAPVGGPRPGVTMNG